MEKATPAKKSVYPRIQVRNGKDIAFFIEQHWNQFYSVE